MAFGDADFEADGFASGEEELLVAFAGGDFDGRVGSVRARVGGAEELREIDFQIGADFGAAGDRGGFVLREDDRVFGANATARGATLAAVVGLFDEDGFLGVDAVDAEEAEVDALQAIRAAAEVDDRVPPPVSVFVDDGGMWALCCGLWALSLSVAGSIGVPVTVSGTIAIGEPLPAGEIALHLFRFGGALDPTREFEGGGAEFAGDAANFVEVDGR